jgi:hypothetical protein
MADHLVRAEASIETALADLRAKQSAWQAAIKNQDLSKDQLRALRRTMRNARKSIYLAITEWEQMMDQYTMTMAPA